VSCWRTSFRVAKVPTDRSPWVITLRKGDDVEVLREQIDAAVAAGFAAPRRRSSNGAGFVRNPGLPMLILETFAGGTVIPQHGEVSAGQTGVVVSLT
jgi:hypothetical protein